MKTYIATISDYEGFIQIEGRGTTMEEAKVDLFSKLAVSIQYDVEEGRLRLPVIETVPNTLPEGCVLVVLERCSHNSGFPYDYRYVSIPKGKAVYHPFEGVTDQIDENEKISFTDCNADYRFGLPDGSFEHKDGVWVEAQKIEYDY